MPQKERISDEAFPWVKSTSGTTKKQVKKSPVKKKSVSTVKKKVKASEKPVTAKKTSAVPKKNDSASSTGKNDSEFSVFVLFNKKGTILSIVRMNTAYLPESKMPFATTKDTHAAEVTLPDEFADKDMAEIHRQCVVRGIGTKPYLAKK